MNTIKLSELLRWNMDRNNSWIRFYRQNWQSPIGIGFQYNSKCKKYGDQLTVRGRGGPIVIYFHDDRVLDCNGHEIDPMEESVDEYEIFQILHGVGYEGDRYIPDVGACSICRNEVGRCFYDCHPHHDAALFESIFIKKKEGVEI